jgi:quercetin dioxygenase-like cupin family protein
MNGKGSVSEMSLYSWDDIPEEQVTEELGRKLVWGKKVMLARISLKKGCIVPSHRHESEQASFVLSGSLEFALPGKKVKVEKGQVLVVPSDVEHSALAVEETITLDIFSPIREDWLTGQDSYLRKK